MGGGDVIISGCAMEEMLISVGAQCDQLANLKLFVRQCEFSLSYCHDAVLLNGTPLERWT